MMKNQESKQSQKKPINISIKKKQTDICNICLKEKILTWDHVPPKGSGNRKAKEIKTFFKNIDYINTDNIQQKFVHSQNGLKFRTLCKECNSLLGEKYDAEFNTFTNDLIKHVNTTITLPSVIHLTKKPRRIILSLLGHFLAKQVRINNENASDNTFRSTLNNEIRSALLNNNHILPNINIFYWIYPFQETKIVTWYPFHNVFNKSKNDVHVNFIECHLIKFFPVSYLITNDMENYNDLPNLMQYKTLSIDAEVPIPIYFNKQYEANFPEWTVPEQSIHFMSTENNDLIASNRNP